MGLCVCVSVTLCVCVCVCVTEVVVIRALCHVSMSHLSVHIMMSHDIAIIGIFIVILFDSIEANDKHGLLYFAKSDNLRNLRNFCIL